MDNGTPIHRSRAPLPRAPTVSDYAGAYWPPPPVAYLPPPPTLGEELRTMIRALLVRWWIIGFVTLMGLALAIGYIWVTPPEYAGTTQVLIDPRAKRLIESEVVPTGLGQTALGGDTQLIDSQIHIIGSRSILDRLIEREGLEFDREFGYRDGSGPLAETIDSIKAFIRGPWNADLAPISPYDLAMRKIWNRLHVERMGNTYVIRISMRTRDPEKAARLANSVTQIYLEDANRAASETTAEAAESLEGRIAELRRSAEEAQRAVEAYRTANNLIGAQNVLIVEQQLADANDRLSAARGRTQAAEAAYNQVRSLVATGSLSGVGTDALDSPAMIDLRRQLAQAQANEASLGTTLLPNHPQLDSARRSREAVENALRAETRRIAERLKIEVDTAREAERSLERAVAGLESRTADANVATVRLRELQGEADARQQVYRAFLTRSKEAAEQVGLPTDTARVISYATIPSRPISPVLSVVLLAGVALGGMAGLGLAWLLHLLRGTPEPAPRQEVLVSARRRDRTPAT